MAKPITFDNIFYLVNDELKMDGDFKDSLAFFCSEKLKINMRTNGTTCTIYDGNSNKIPDYWLGIYGNCVVENVTLIPDKTIRVTLKQDDFDATFSDVFYQYLPPDYLYVIARDVQDQSKEQQLFEGSMDELPVLLFNEIKDVPVFIDAMYLDDSGDGPRNYIILKAHL